ncbi:prolipoprotein diacylglyceryl transferase [Novosphingobium sp. 1949]|uniref:Prolipoprotein diacylglyceryl transferase n=1 Tax=Novosphingobium organovorum TaxID=2930092 RepID=A0ABT0BJ98_9SPHN|nr:prolipoprotein diacylglyceryl transferase family protein [Novosphingobium organovorum]MCJ2184923.1 prolipoprotein diacylglyceryl transferase [Novosphingobium organovorum]
MKPPSNLPRSSPFHLARTGLFCLKERPDTARRGGTIIVIPTAPWAHTLGDGAAWIGASVTAFWQHRRWPREADALARVTTPSYYVTLALGALIGAWAAGTANSLRLTLAPSHSVAGALVGGIVAVEAWKVRHGLRRSTGGAYVLPMAVGLAIGRLGCLFAGLPDLTYGTPTALPWGVDLGDGIARHPVELYEALAMALFALIYARARLAGAGWVETHGFHVFAAFYGAQRFAWEFAKPYPTLVGPFNLFHFLCLGMICYGLLWVRLGRSGHRAPPPARTQGGALPVPQPDDEPVRNLP